MKKTLTNIAIGGGVLLICAVVAGNYQLVSQAFNLVGAVVRGAGSVTLILLGQGDSVMRSYQNSSNPARPNIGDDGSADEAEPLANYRDNN